ncbi:MAG: trypsin-like peptidase domain-containing protein [Bryobacteraceae bacterium]|nr:trypsin-like peptidase domain-containing protein [Bryobacteraceae bacterium]
MSAPGFGEVAESLRRATVEVRSAERRAGGGSGVIWRPDGLIVTNAHVARDSQPVVQFWDGRRFPARVTARDARRDLAALRVDTKNLPAATAADSDAVRVGELVIAVGNPLGFSGALTTGVVHALGRLTGLSRQKWIQANVRLAPGNSGGPLANARGEIIGINTMVAGELGLAVPSNSVSDFLRRGASTPMLGVVVRPVPAGQSVGLLVLEVERNSPAEAASLQTGDLLIAAEGRYFVETDDLSATLERAKEIVRVRFLRGDRAHPREVAVRLPERVSEAA